jgi:hypothetical protein
VNSSFERHDPKWEGRIVRYEGLAWLIIMGGPRPSERLTYCNVVCLILSSKVRRNTSIFMYFFMCKQSSSKSKFLTGTDIYEHFAIFIYSVPYWRVFSSTVTNDERRIPAHTLNSLTNDVCLMNLSGISDWFLECMNELPFISATRPEYKSPYRTVNYLVLLCLLPRKQVFVCCCLEN